MQIYAAQGYAVLAVNFHGSTGFGTNMILESTSVSSVSCASWPGHAFTHSISKNWGGAPYQDIMTGIDYALEHYPWLDGSKMVALGASYGGMCMSS